MRHVVPSPIFRLRARTAMKPVMSILLVVALIAALPSLLQSLTVAVTEADPNLLAESFLNRLLQLTEQTDLSQAELLTGMRDLARSYEQENTAFWQEKGPVYIGTSLLTGLLSPVLMLGMVNALLHAVRKQDFTPAIALSRMGCILKVIGLMLLMVLRIFLWMLPGMAVTIASAFLPEDFMALGLVAGSVLMIVLGVRVAFRYVLAEIFLADTPEMRIRDCLRRSHEVMKGRRMEFFFLSISFIGWELLLSLVTSMLLAMLGNVLGMTLGMFASLLLTVYTNCAMVCFYQEYAVGPVNPSEAEDAAPEPLN